MPEDTTSAQLPRLRELREATGESMERVAADLEVAKETVQRWEKGQRQIPAHYLRPLALRYGVSIDYLLGWDREAA